MALTRSVILALLCAALAVCVSCTSPTPAAQNNDTERVLTTGNTVGLLNDSGAHEWRGLPYAAPPTGEWRWRPPQPPASWSGTRTAIEYDNICPQFKGTGDSVIGAEDCLYANVLAPPFAPDSVPRREGLQQVKSLSPVMVYIHGGGNSVGHSAENDWSGFATEHGVIVVSLQYRLGALGWFRYPSLLDADASAAEKSGNFALLDLLQGLRWVQDNATAFGGDPNNVTVFGTSAGAANILALLQSPLSQGLFHRAILQSGVLASDIPTEVENAAAVVGYSGSSHEILVALLSNTNDIDRTTAEQQAAAMSQIEITTLLRSTPPSKLLAAYPRMFGPTYKVPDPFRDGYVLPELSPMATFRNGNFIQVPILMGTARDEIKLHMLMEDHSLQRLFGFPIGIANAKRYELISEYGSRRWKARSVDQVAAAMNESGHTPIFAYRTDWDDLRRFLTLDFKVLMGAMHGIDLPLLADDLENDGFGLLVPNDERPAAQELGAAMRSYWAEFVHTGNPGHGRDKKLPQWQKWQSTEEAVPSFIVFDTPADGGIRRSSNVESDSALIDEIAGDSRFESECDRCDALAGRDFGYNPNYSTLPQACQQYFSEARAFDCSATR